MVDARARVKRQGTYVACTVTARPVSDARDGDSLILVTFQDRPARRLLADGGARSIAVQTPDDATLVRQIEYELKATREDLQGTIDELEELERGAESVARRSHVDERGAPVDQRRGRELEGGTAVVERGVDHGQQSTPGQGAGAGRRQQRHDEPAGQHRDRHDVSRCGPPHQALHTANHQAAEPAPGRPRPTVSRHRPADHRCDAVRGLPPRARSALTPRNDRPGRRRARVSAARVAVPHGRQPHQRSW